MWITTLTNDKKIKINTDSIALMYPDELTVVLYSGTEVQLSGAEYEELEKSMFPKRKTYSKDDTELASYLNSLHKLTGGKNEAILTPERKVKLDKLLKTFTREQLTTAATNIGKDTWLQGDNEKKKRWGDIDYLMRPDKAAKWAEYKSEGNKKRMF